MLPNSRLAVIVTTIVHKKAGNVKSALELLRAGIVVTTYIRDGYGVQSKQARNGYTYSSFKQL